VFSNLLANALKYGAGKPVQVEIGQQAEQAVIRVVDHGLGIAAGDIERIFARFERAVPLRHYGGLGLGLYIVRQIVQAHGGVVKAEQTDGGGATFVVELPVDGVLPAPVADSRTSS
jgi:signal transduction histidine kinase